MRQVATEGSFELRVSSFEFKPTARAKATARALPQRTQRYAEESKGNGQSTFLPQRETQNVKPMFLCRRVPPPGFLLRDHFARGHVALDDDFDRSGNALAYH